MFRTLGVCILAVFPSFSLAADNPATGFIHKTFKNANGSSSPYVVFIPRDYDGTKVYPVILFLHGSGETKGGDKMPVEVGIGTAIGMREQSFPFITIFPQSEKRTWKADSEDGHRAMAILDEVVNNYKTDPQRIYLTGLSMGGSGTWSLAAAYPWKWAAIAPICGRGNTEDAVKIKDIPCWCFHGEADLAVPVRHSRQMIDALHKVCANPRYTEYPKVGHNSWDNAYGTDELYTWLLEQKNYCISVADNCYSPGKCVFGNRIFPCERAIRTILNRRAGCR
jgi:predicted peptidase